MLKYKFLSNYISVIEPSADMEIKLYDAYRSSTSTFKYTVCSVEDLSICQEGVRSYNATTKKSSASHVNFDCDPFDKFTITVKEYSLDNPEYVASTFEGNVICMYVRREIRSLPTSDLNYFMDSMFKIWSTPDTEGIAKYGENFHNISYLLKFHHFNAADRRTDHIHNGNGILMQHVKFTNILESTLQAIDPSLYLPYWDFTIDSSEGKLANESYVMNANMFGAMKKSKIFEKGFTYTNDKIADGAIMNGRWKNYISDNNVFEDMDFGYGYMRAPWNLNPSPFVSRFNFNFTTHKMPNCNDHYNLLNINNLMTFFNLGEFAPHGNVHILTGGAFGCDKFDKLLADGFIIDETTAKKMCVIWSPVIMKTAYRYHYVTPEKNCVPNFDNLESSECSYTCPDDKKDDLFKFISKFKYSADQLNIDIAKEGAQDAWIDFICGGDGGKVFSGDNYESASPIDPIFWLIHPPLERLLQAKFMSDGFKSEEWYTDAVTQNVCDFAQCYDEATNTLDYFEDCCYGHFESDRLLDAISGERSQFFGPTNAETLAATDPRSETYSMPYIYDSFTWDHCNEDFVGYLTQGKKKRNDNN